MIRCIAIDDEPMALDVIKVFCEKIPFLQLSHSFTQVSAATKHLKTFPVDLIFLDIQMPDLNGIDFYKNFKEDALVIFTTVFMGISYLWLLRNLRELAKRAEYRL